MIQGIEPISSALTSEVTQMTSQPQSQRVADGGSLFSDVIHTAVQENAQIEREASQSVMGLLSGKGVEVHDAMIATQRADLQFELALQVRNKAVSALQQMMQMQF